MLDLPQDDGTCKGVDSLKPGVRTGQRLLALFFLGCLLLNFPLLSLFSTTSQLWGIPLLYGYVLFCWAFLIIIMALLIERR